MEQGFRKLASYIETGDGVQSYRFMLELASSLRQELHASVIDTYLLNIFDDSFGLLFFINETVNIKTFVNAVSEAFEILCTLINNQPLALAKHTPKIRQSCIQAIVSTITEAKVKRRALDLLKLILEKTDFFPSDDPLKPDVILEKLSVRLQNSNGTVLASCIATMGFLVKKYPTVVKDDKILQIFVNKLQNAVNSTNEEELAGCFNCISNVLEQYEIDLKQLYRAIKTLMEKNLPYKKMGHRACLALLTKHTELFSDQLYADMWWWRQKLSTWLDFKGDDCKAGYLALDAITQKISKRFTSPGSAEDSAVCSRIISGFVEDINNPLLHGFKLRLAIRGLGFFIDAAKVHLSADEITVLFIDTIQRIEKIYLIDKPDGEHLENLPDYIQTLSNIIKQLDNLSDYEIGILQQAMILMIKLFPNLSLMHHNLVIQAVKISLIHLKKYKNEIFGHFLQNIVKQGIIWSCSHVPVAFADSQKDNSELITYRKFLPFWRSILEKPNEKADDYQMLKTVTDRIFQEFILTLFVLIGKLNLNTKPKESSYILTDPEKTLEAIKDNDFDIFINLVDFYVDLLKGIDALTFKKCIPMYVSYNIAKSYKHPLVSGFYKLLSAGLEIANKVNYFDSSELKNESVKICYDSVSVFLHGMLPKIKQYKGDLQIACIQLVLSAPVTIIRNILPNLSSVFITLFSLGRSNLKLAESGITTLEVWYESIPMEELEAFLKQILPSLDSYLTSKSLGENFDTQSAKQLKTKQILSRRKIIVLQEKELFNLQKRILVFVSQLSNDLCASLAEGNTNIVEAITWSKNPHLKITLSFSEVNLNIYLDNFVPRIVELALHCSERSVRINACEVLHSIVVLMLGTSFSMNETKAKDFDTLLEKISYPLLQLGCDQDQTVQEIFQPLVIQLMHWYSSPQQKFSMHTAIIIETLMDGITQSTDCAVRDFTCTCIHEFIKWTIKQTTEESIQREPINIKIFTRKIRHFSLHTDPSKRLAAALIFNNVYTILREESFIFNAFWLEMLHSFILNLSLIDEYDQYNCLDLVHQCLKHLERGFVEKCAVFNKENKDRRIPPGFEGGKLKDVATWLLHQTGSINPHCREYCIKMFLRLAPLVDKAKNSAQGFMKVYKVYDNSSNWLLELYDHQIKNYSEFSTSISYEILTKWIPSLLCGLDGHIFLFENNIAPAEYDLYKSEFYSAMVYFFENVSSREFNEFTMSIIERQHFNKLRTKVVEKTISLMTVLLKLKCCGDLEKFLRDYGWNTFCKFIFELDLEDDFDQHGKTISDLMTKLNSCCSRGKIEELKTVLGDYIDSKFKSPGDLKANVTIKGRHLLQGLLILQKSVLSVQLNIPFYTKDIIANIFNNLVENHNGQLIVINLQDSTKQYCDLLLQFALDNDDEFVKLLQFLCDDRLVKCSKTNEFICYGDYIFQNFKHIFIKFILANWLQFFDYVLPVSTPVQTHNFISEILRYVEANRKNFDDVSVMNITEGILKRWNLLKPFFDENVERKIVGLEMLEKISHLVNEDMKVRLDVGGVYEWIVEALVVENSSWSTQHALTYLTHVINVLPLITGHREEFKIELENALKKVQNKYFEDVPQAAKVAVTITMNKAFDAAIVSKSNLLFKFACVSYAFVNLEPNSINVTNICETLMSKLDIECQTKLLTYMHDLCLNDLPPNCSYIIARDILINLVRFSNYSAFEKFYVDAIVQIMEDVKLKNDSEESIAKKTVSYILIKILFSRLNLDKIQDKTCPITRAAFSEIKDGKELIRAVTKISSEALKQKASDVPDNLKENFRVYLCHCYNALVCLISNTQKNSAFYKMLFVREVNKENMLWRNLIDNSKDYTFEMDFDKLPMETKALVSIRSTRQAERKRMNQSQSVRYLESQYLFKSTLSEDVHQYDFTRSVIRSQPLIQEDGDDEKNEVEMVIDIDAIEISSHECMTTLCGLIQHMVDEEITPAPDGVPIIPDWMDAIKNELISPNAPKNVKLFLVKVIETMQHIFKPYAKDFYNGVIQLILDGHAGLNINYFIADLVAMLISWSEFAHSIEETTAASNLLQFLMSNVNSDRPDIMKFHLELIKTFVEPWKTRITVPTDYIYSKLTSLVLSKKADVIIHICAVLLANNLAPWKSSQIKDFVKYLCKTLDSNYLSVYRPCAAVVGMALQHVETSNEYKIHLNSFEGFIVGKLKKCKSDNNKCLNCLQEIIKYYPRIAAKFVDTIVYDYQNLTNDFKMICLKIFLASTDSLHESRDFLSFDFSEFIDEYNSVEAQILGMQIVQNLIPKMSAEKLAVVEHICNFINSPSHACRSVMYDILIMVYDIYSNKNDDKLSGIVAKCKDILLQGLVDQNPDNEKKIKEFWLNEKNLPNNLFERFTFILKNMYKPSTEKDFLGYFIYFVLNELTHTDGFSQNSLFDYQLSECVFRDYNVNSNWRTMHVSLAPMFASTFKSLDPTFSMAHDAEPGYLRATQTLMDFEPTVKAESQDFNDYSSTFLAEINENAKPNVSDDVFKVPLPVSEKSKLRRRRFYRDQSKISRGFAFREVERSKKAEEQRRDSAKQKEQSVQLYRKYRVGDFPDIDIKLSDIITSLQELSKVDTHIARQFYTTLFQAIFKKVTSQGNEDEFIGETVTAINIIFNSSVQFVPNVMGAFLDVALTYKDKMQFQPDTLSKLAQYSGLIPTGSLLLEEYLILGDDSALEQKRGRGYSEDPQVKCWVKLAELYKELNEWDIVRSIFLEKMNCSETVMKAIDAESQGCWRDAQHFYRTVIGEDESLDRRDFYYESYYKCFAELSDWNNLSASIKNTVEADGSQYWAELWDQDWNQQKLLPWYITAEVRNGLENEERMQKLLEDLNTAMSDEVKLEYIKTNFCEELAFLWLLQSKTDKAMRYLNIYVQNFLSNWSNLSPLLTSLRTQRLTEIRNALDMYNFINKMDSMKENNFKKVTLSLNNSWMKLFNENISSIVASETKTLYRRQLIQVLRKKISSEFGDGDCAGVYQRLDDLNFGLGINLIKSAIKVHNFHVAKKYMMEYSDYIEEMNSLKHVVCNLAYCKILYVKALQMVTPEEKLKYLIEAWNNADSCLQNDLLRSNKTVFLSTQTLVFDITQSVKSDFPPDVKISEFPSIATLCHPSVINGLEDVAIYGFVKLQEVVEATVGMRDQSLNEVYLKLAYFAYDGGQMYTAELIKFILKAMYYGSSEARQIFPCILSIESLGSDYKDIFVEHTREIPEWMFIEWIPQLLANLGSPHIFAINEIVLRIARTYPQAIMYAYRLSKEKYSIGDDDVGRYCQEILATLDELLLGNPLVDKMLLALSSVSSATNIMTYYFKKLFKACNENSAQKVKDILENVKSVRQSASNYKKADSIHGAVFETVSIYLDKLIKICSVKFDSKKIKMSLATIKNDIEKISKEKSKHKNKLSFYSPWLERFAEKELNLDIEIPGQYRGDRKPLPQYHVKISGFSPEVLEFQSLRKPIKLTFIGSDAKEYPYVVKYGEDLRQDQRVEQMFGLINTILTNDAVCHEKRLKIRTYQVVPLTSSLGIIEFVDNTMQIGSFIEKADPQMGRAVEEATRNFITKYLCTTDAELRKKGEKEIYDRAVLKLSREKTIAAYRASVNCIPWDILRKALWNVSVSPESFIALRYKFVTTHSVNCISNWILGIGDRHLSNSLVSSQNGEIIDIDFGHAFGSAVQLLPMPELVPFRLTPHFVNLMQPFNEHGLIQETMVHVMRALRKNAPSLLATMNVFIKEPSLEWLEFMNMLDDYGKATWCPDTKIAQAKRKLEGANPVNIMIEELMARSHDNSTLIAQYVSHVKGDPKDNVRARKPSSSLTVEDQVKCLLDHATDYNLLGRMYAGWRAFI